MPITRPKEMNFYRPENIWFKPKYFLTGIFFLSFIFLVWTQSNSAKEMTVVNGPAVIATQINLVSTFTYTEKIKEGVSLLKISSPLKYETKNGSLNGELTRKQIALAILNKETGEVFEHKVWVKESEIKNYHQSRIINVELNSDLKITVNWWNSFNTDYGFPKNPNFVVVANKYLWLSSNLSTLPERSQNKYTEIIYAPYSAGLHVDELIENGRKYIEDNVETAFSQLTDAKIGSRFKDGQIITSGIQKDFIKSILVIEHIDPDAFKLAGDDGKELAERVLVIIGANKERSYRYTGSPAGANGLAQFIRPTYQNIISKYPQANMVKDYTLGMADHVNAVKAMVLFFDEHKKSLTNSILRKDIAKTLGINEEMLAAAYNGGPGRVSSSINKFGTAWISSQIKLSTELRILRLETLDYISKLQAIKKLGIF